MFMQEIIKLKPKSRGYHLITPEIISQMPNIDSVSIGLCNIFIQHTSASLSINENYDPDVRRDMEMVMNKIAPDAIDGDDYTHTLEGADDMPAHVKSSLIGASINIPISKGKLALGMWQGIWLGEHRNSGGSRTIIVTVQY